MVALEVCFAGWLHAESDITKAGKKIADKFLNDKFIDGEIRLLILF
jgi:hypothetical protein